jgi:hypothetical protein
MHLKTGWLKNSYFRGNLSVLAISSAFTNMGTGAMALFMPEYFQRLGGNTLILGLMGFAVLIIRLAMYLIGGFTGGLTYQTLNPTAPFYIFTITELVAVLLLVAAVKEPTKKEE